MEDGMKVFYSYVTPVAFQPKNSAEVVVSENVWSVTTAKHLNWIEDWAGYPRKQNRLKRDEWLEAFMQAKGHEYEPKNDMIKTTAMVSKMFGLLSGGSDPQRELEQKKRFFEIAGCTFPEDWEGAHIWPIGGPHCLADLDTWLKEFYLDTIYRTNLPLRQHPA